MARLLLTSGRRAVRAAFVAAALGLGALAPALAPGPSLAAPAGGAHATSAGDRWIWPDPPGIASRSPAFYDVRRHALSFLEWQRSILWTLTPDTPRTWAPAPYPASNSWPEWLWAYDPAGDRLLVLEIDFVRADTCCSARTVTTIAQLDLGVAPAKSMLPVRGDPPLYRDDCMVVYDSRRRHVLVLGGRDPDRPSAFSSRVDMLDAGGDSAAWTGFDAAAPALPVCSAQAVYDSLTDRVIAVGGFDSTGNARSAVYSLDLGAPAGWQRWAGVDSIDTPAISRDGTRLFLDPGRRRLLLTRSPGASFVGAGAERPLSPESTSGAVDSTMVWQLGLDAPSSWTPIPYAGPLASWHLGQVVYDPVRDRISSYGTEGRLDLTELVLDGASPWTTIRYTNPAPRADDAHAFLDRAHDRYLLVDSWNRNLWALERGATDTWHPMFNLTAPPASRVEAAVIFDPVDERGIVFGGNVHGVETGDLWQFTFVDSVRIRWDRIFPEGDVPPPRFGASAVLDPLRHRIVLFGGYAGRPLDDTWELRLDPPLRWRRLPDRGLVPPARWFASAVYDSRRDMMIVHGGETGEAPSPLAADQTWALSFADGDAWVPITALGTPPSPRSFHNAVYDPLRDRMIVFWGEIYYTGLTDCVELDLADGPTWRRFEASGPMPPTRANFGAFYDPDRDRAICLGGQFLGPFAFSTNSSYADFSANPVRTPPPLHGPPLAVLGLVPNPTRDVTALAFDLPVDADVRARIYDARGRLVRDLGPRRYVAGRHLLVWDGKDARGAVPASGVYFAQLAVLGRTFSGKVVLLR